tara:strand:- start:1 stop:162 length:162 start_codon:yes stop_codon:yes gene_type:complete
MRLVEELALVVQSTFLEPGQQSFCVFDESFAGGAPINTKPLIFKASETASDPE